MVEYLYDAIRATAGTDITIAAEATDELGNVITDGCSFVLHLDDNKMVSTTGDYFEGVWSFTIPADITKDLKGRYWYCVKHYDSQLCFKQPIYFV
jgi:hypothetical protein